MDITTMSEEERYNNRQVEKMFDDQSRDIKEHLNLLITPLTNQVTITNGTVKWQTKLLYTGLGALILLVPWAGWVTTSLLQQDTVTEEELKEAVDDAITVNLEDY